MQMENESGEGLRQDLCGRAQNDYYGIVPSVSPGLSQPSIERHEIACTDMRQSCIGSQEGYAVNGTGSNPI